MEVTESKPISWPSRFLPGSAKGWVWLLGWAYLLTLILVLGAIRSVGERSALTAILAFFPLGVWLLPLAGLLPMAIVWNRHCLALHFVCAILVLAGFGRLELNSGRHGNDQFVSVMTNNVGQANGQSLFPFVDSMKPDILLIQEANHSTLASQRAFPDRYIAGEGDFRVMSKYPILNWSRVDDLRWRGSRIAARFEIAVRGQRLVLYNVHLPTPRQDILRFTPLDVLNDVLDPSVPDGGVDRSFRASMHARVKLGASLIERIKQESLPVIVAGDFNMPDVGYMYGLFQHGFHDAFGEAGFGYGYTFPGYTRNPFSLFQPWLRIDYIFSSRDLVPVEAVVEPRRRSQHRAVFAAFRLNLP